MAGLPTIRQAGLTRPSNIQGSATAARSIQSSWNALESAAANIRRTLEPALVEGAKEQGREDVESGEARRRTVLTQSDAAYNQAVTARLLSRARMDADRQAIDLMTEFAADPEGFEKASRGYIDNYIKEMDSDFGVEVQDMLESRMNAGLLDVSQERRRVDLEESKQSLFQLRATLQAELETLIDTAGPEVIGGEEYTALIDELSSVNNILIDNPVIPYTEEQGEQFLRDLELSLSASVMEKQVEAAFQEGGVAAGLAKADELAKDDTLQISSENRSALTNRLRGRVSDVAQIENAKWQEERRREIQANEAQQDMERAATIEMLRLRATGELTSDYLVQNRHTLGPSGFDRGLNILSSEGDSEDDLFKTTRMIEARNGALTPDTITQDVQQGFYDSTFANQLLEKVEGAENDLFQAGREIVDAGLKPGPFDFNNTMATYAAEANEQVFGYVQDNPEATRPEVLEFSREVTRRFGGKALLDPNMPALWNGARPRSLKEVDTMKAALASSNLPIEEKKRELQKLKTYEAAARAAEME